MDTTKKVITAVDMAQYAQQALDEAYNFANKGDAEGALKWLHEHELRMGAVLKGIARIAEIVQEAHS